MNVLNTSQIALAWELFEHGIPKSRIAADLGKTRETIHIWIKGITKYRLLEFLDREDFRGI